MLRILTLIMDVFFLCLLIFTLVALWGFRDMNSVEDVPALIRVSKGQVTILDPVNNKEHKGGGLQTLKVGQTVSVDTGSDAFLFYADGSVSRLTGPASVRLTESQRTIRKPAILSSLKQKLFKSPPPPPAESSITVRAVVLEGDVTTKSAATSTSKLFELRGPGVVVFPIGASFAVNVPKQGDVSIEVAKGQVGIGFVSLQGQTPLPVVVPELAAPKGIYVPAVPAEIKAAGEIVERVAVAIPALAKGATTIEGVDYRQVTDAGIAHYIGTSMDGRPLISPPAVTTHTVVNTKIIEESVVVPDTATVTVTDRQLADSIPADIPGNPKVHIMSGGVFQLELYGVTAIVNINIVDGRAELQGLPFGIDPPQLEDAIKNNLGVQELPALLSIESKDGEATITYAKDVTVTSTSVVTEEVEVPDAIPHTSSYFSTIPTPREISTDWKVVGSNAIIALVLTLLVSAMVAPVNGFVKENEGRIARAYAPFVKGVKTAWRPVGAVAHFLRWFSPGHLTRGVWLMFIFGAIYSFLAVGSGLLSPGGLTVLLTLSFTSGFMSLYLPWVKSFVARRMKLDVKVALNPGQLTVAAVTVGISRVFAFKPGLMLGSPSGLKMPVGGLTEKQEFRLEVSALVAFAVLAAISWGMVLLVVQMSAQPWAADFFKTAKGFVSGLQDWGLAVFAMAVQALFFGLLPRPKTFSWDFMQKHAPIWGVSFAIASFVFIHTQLNKQKTILDLTTNMIVTAAVVAGLAILVLGYQWQKGKKHKKAPEPPKTPEPPKAADQTDAPKADGPKP